MKKTQGYSKLPSGDRGSFESRDHGVIAERWAWLGHGGRNAGNALPHDVCALKRARDTRLIDRGSGGEEAIAALYATFKVAAEALSRARGFRIRALKVGVRVVRRSGQGRGESRRGWLVDGVGGGASGGGFRNRSVVVVVIVLGGVGDRRYGCRRRHRRLRRLLWRERRGRKVDVTRNFLDGGRRRGRIVVLCARRRPSLFGAFGGGTAVSRVDRVPTGSRGSDGRHRVPAFSRAFGHSAGHT